MLLILHLTLIALISLSLYCFFTAKDKLAVLLGMLATVLIFLLLDITREQRSISGHYCTYKHCPFKGQNTFTQGCGECPPYSDCWKLDSIHFKYPALSYDGCDSLLTK